MLDEAQPHHLVDVGGVLAAEAVAAADGVHHAQVAGDQIIPGPLVAVSGTRDEVTDGHRCHAADPTLRGRSRT